MSFLKTVFYSFMMCQKPLFIECDASKKGLGCVLLQPVYEMGEKDIVNASNMNDFLSHSKPVAYAN